MTTNAGTLTWQDRLQKARGHAFITKEAIKAIPRTYTTAEYTTKQMENVEIKLKFFSPYSNWTWYVIELDPEDGYAYGIVDGFEVETGYFDIFEMAAIEKNGLPLIERDCYFTTTTVGEVRKALNDRR